jgi:AcrR family transcriptional regulator
MAAEKLAKKLGRPTEVDKEKIIEVARTLFAEHGYEAASTRMIAQQAGCNVAMIGYYFGNKEGLLNHIVDTYFKEMTKLYSNFNEPSSEDLSGEFPEFSDPEIRQFCKALIEYGRYAFSHRKIHQIIIRDAMSGGNLLINALAKNENGVVPLIQKRLRYFVEKKKLPADLDIQVTGMSLSSPVINSCISTVCLMKIHNFESIDDAFFRRLYVHHMRSLFQLYKN